MYRLGAFSYRHRRAVLAAWLVALVLISGVGRSHAGKFSQRFHLAGTGSQQASDLLSERFPARAGGTGSVVFRGTPDVASHTAEVAAVLDRVKQVPHVRSILGPFDTGGARQVSKDGTIAFAQVQFDVDEPSLPRAVAEQLKSLVTGTHVAGLDVELAGGAFQERRPPGSSELVGVLAAVVILLVAFGSVLAMGLPILIALFGIGIGLAGVEILANWVSVPEFAPQLAAMLGIGVGIDYALFIVTRYRHGLDIGLEPSEAVPVAVATSGKAVLFAGCTVVISLLGLFLMGIEFVRGLAYGAVIAVAVTMFASITLLPAILGFVGRTIDRLSLPWLHRTTPGKETIWHRWASLIQRRPWTAALAGLAILLALASPVFSIELGSSDAGNLPKADTTRRAYDLLAQGFGPGYNGPLILAVDARHAKDTAALGVLRDVVSGAPGVAFASPAIPNQQRDTAVIQVFPTTSPQDHRTVELIHRLRNDIIPAATAGTGLRVYVGGITAAFDDIAAKLQSRLPLFIGAVLALSFILLLAVFRSVLVPLKAVVMNLLSIGATYGVLVAVFQHGVGASIIGVGKRGPIESFAPMMLFAILFGLSMDYEVFLLSRVKEEWDRTRDNQVAVTEGLAHTARVITAAAAIMVTVFGSFVFGDNRIIKELGLGLAVAILVDATVVRMLLVPATMELLGNANWWLPGWLARFLPDIRIESEPELLETKVPEAVG